ncbi:hypothetical protein B5K03_33830 [Rhizobium phaseoli]|nr:hypothetical protein B5K03_33830 [Rhizobium phaseoli]
MGGDIISESGGGLPRNLQSERSAQQKFDFPSTQRSSILIAPMFDPPSICLMHHGDGPRGAGGLPDPQVSSGITTNRGIEKDRAFLAISAQPPGVFRGAAS